MKHSRRVNLVADAESGLYLCPSDISPANFRKCEDGRLVALDFGATCFMPRSFMGVAMRMTQNPFCQMVARKITYPKSDDVSAMVLASNYIVMFGRGPFGGRDFSFFILLLGLTFITVQRSQQVLNAKRTSTNVSLYATVYQVVCLALLFVLLDFIATSEVALPGAQISCHAGIFLTTPQPHRPHSAFHPCLF